MHARPRNEDRPGWNNGVSRVIKGLLLCTEPWYPVDQGGRNVNRTRGCWQDGNWGRTDLARRVDTGSRHVGSLGVVSWQTCVVGRMQLSVSGREVVLGAENLSFTVLGKTCLAVALYALACPRIPPSR